MLDSSEGSAEQQVLHTARENSSSESINGDMLAGNMSTDEVIKTLHCPEYCLSIHFIEQKRSSQECI